MKIPFIKPFTKIIKTPQNLNKKTSKYSKTKRIEKLINLINELQNLTKILKTILPNIEKNSHQQTKQHFN